ncbi:MAG: hypothetical protein PVI90_10585 [Desulfobacteraceae bacterium]|jgi:hypothetical protein
MQWVPEAEAALEKVPFFVRKVLLILQRCLDLYKSKCFHGQRFGEILSDTEFDSFIRIFDGADGE